MGNFINSTISRVVSAASQALSSFKIPAVISMGNNCEVFSKLSDYFAGRSAEVSALVSGFSGFGDAIIAVADDTDQTTYQIAENDEFYPTAMNALTDVVGYFKQHGSITNDGYYAITVTVGDGSIVCLACDESRNAVMCATDDDDNWEDFIRHVVDEIEYIEIHPVIHTMSGDSIRFNDVLASLVNNSSLLDMYYVVASSFTDPNVNLAALASSVLAYASKAKDVVINEARTLCSVITSGGASGVLSYLAALYSSVGSMSYSDGEVSFSNNADLMPIDFGTGLVSLIPTAISTIATVCLTIINPVIGLITGAITMAINSLAPQIDYLFNSADKASVNQNGNIALSPFNCGTGVFSKSSMQHSEAAQSMVDIGALFRIEYPGADLICYRRETGEFYYEVHVDLVDRRAALLNMLYRHMTYTPENRGSYPYMWINTVEVDISSITAEQIAALPASTTSIDIDPETAVFSKHNDRLLRSIIMCNMFIFALYLFKSGSMAYRTPKLSVSWYAESEFIQDTHEEYPCEMQSLEVDQWPDPDYALTYCRWMGWILYMIKNSDHYGAPFMIPDNFTDTIPSWAQLIIWADSIVKLVDTQDNTVLPYIAFANSDDLSRMDLLACNSMPTFTGFTINIPKYNSATMLRDLWAAIGITAAVTAVVAAVTITAKIALNKWAARRAANVENLWAQATAHPTAANINAYQKAVTKNNILSSIFGGSKFSKQSYWGASDSTVANDSTGLAQLISLIKGSN